MQPLQSILGDLRSSTAISTAVEFETLATYIDRDPRYGRYGSNPPKRLIDLETGGFRYLPNHSQSLTQKLKVGVPDSLAAF